MAKKITCYFTVPYINIDWLYILNENSVESTVYNLMAVASPVILFVEHRKSTFSHWFSNSVTL